MEIEEVKTWQWMLAGLIAGALFSCVIAWSGPAFDTQPRDTIEQGEFENDTFILTRFGHLTGRVAGLINTYHKDMPLVRDVTVHPPIASDPNTYWVTGRFYSIGVKPDDPTKPMGPGKIFEEWKLFKFPAPTPYEPGFTLKAQKKQDLNATSKRNIELASLKKALGGASSYPTVVQYLKAVQSLPDNSSFKFQYAWWELPTPKWTLPPLAGFLMIGVAWPLALSAMQVTGLAKPAPVKQKPKPAKLPARPTVPGVPAGVVLQPVAPAPPPLPTERKEYGGEYYPVVKVTHKE